MIHRLTLTAFGKFRQAEFELSGVTVVFGPNEAGKTTFFDGLFQALCRPSESKKAGKVLKTRYGSGRSASAVISNEVPISDEEFMNLYAIREGDLRLEFEKGTEWLEKLKSRLFHGGMDPSVLAGEFKNRSSDSRSLAHNKDLDKVRETAAKARQELDAKKRLRATLLAREKSLAETESELAETRRFLESAVAEAAGYERQAAAEDRIALRQKWTGQLGRLEDWRALEQAAKDFSAYRIDRREEQGNLSAAARQAAAAILSERGKRELQADLVAQAKAERGTLREALEASIPRSALAKRLGQEAREGSAGTGSAPRFPVWSVAAAFVVATGAAGIVLSGAAGRLSLSAGDAMASSPGDPHQLALLPFALLLLALLSAIAILFAGAHARKKAGREKTARNLERWKDAWQLGLGRGASADPRGETEAWAAGTRAGREMSTVEGFILAMENAARESETWEARESEAKRRLETLRETLENLEASLAGLKDAEETARRAERDWLARLGSADGEEYALKVARSRQLEAELPKRREELEALAQGSDLEVFRREVRRKLQGLDEEGVPEKGLDEAALQRLRRQWKEIQVKQATAAQRERELIAKREGLAGEIRGAFGSLAGEMVEWEDRLAAAEEDIQAKETDKRAAALALEIFKEIGEGADLLLAGLSREMEFMLGHILPGNRAVSLLGLEDRQILLKDAGGGDRSLDALSTGTRHALVLAAKLAMAVKHRQGPGVLVLDEPFLAMDTERENNALELLRDFHIRHGWQIILMTKEIGLRDKVLETFPDPRLLDLSLFP